MIHLDLVTQCTLFYGTLFIGIITWLGSKLLGNKRLKTQYYPLSMARCYLLAAIFVMLKFLKSLLFAYAYKCILQFIHGPLSIQVVFVFHKLCVPANADDSSLDQHDNLMYH